MWNGVRKHHQQQIRRGGGGSQKKQEKQGAKEIFGQELLISDETYKAIDPRWLGSPSRRNRVCAAAGTRIHPDPAWSTQWKHKLKKNLKGSQREGAGA